MGNTSAGPPIDKGAGEEFARSWPVVLGAFIGVLTGTWAFPLYLLGPLLLPLQNEFGWSRTSIGAATSFILAGSLIGAPIAGRFLDRVGVRTTALPSLAMLAVCMAGLGVMSGGIWQLYIIYFAMGLLGAGCNGISYTRAIGAWFSSGRGLAMGLVLAGGGVGSFLAPNLVEQFASPGGWRMACLTVAGLMVLGLPAVYLLIPPTSAEPVTGPVGEGVLSGQAGATRAEAMRDPRFYLMAVTVALFGLSLASVVIHLIPMLTDRGLTSGAAARIASLLGIALIVGRVAIGGLLDRLPPHFVGASMFLLGASGIALFVLAGPNFAPFMVIGLGLLVGAEIDLISFLTLRFFGILHYGSIYGLLFGIYSACSILTPLVATILIRASGYDGLYLSSALAFGIVGALFFLFPWVSRGRNVFAQDDH